MKITVLTFLLFISATLFAQKDTTHKQDSCDNMRLWFDMDNKARDTIPYEDLKEWEGVFFAVPVDITVIAHTDGPRSYEMAINNEERIKIVPPFHHFKNQTLKEHGGTITITNAKVKCWHGDEKPKEYTNIIPKQVFYILPDKDHRAKLGK